ASSLPNAREIVYWGPVHSDNRLTRLVDEHLRKPLSVGVFTATGQPGEWPLARVMGYQATWYAGPNKGSKADLLSVLHRPGGNRLPAMVMAATYGCSRPPNDPRQRTEQGALLCQDWPGFGENLPEHMLSAADV